MAKKITSFSALVYSTDPSIKFLSDGELEQATLPPAQQKLKVKLETKHRAGKAVTLIEGFIGTVADAEELGKKLKSFCGTGGTVKEMEIVVQGDNRDKVVQWLQKNGFTAAKRV